MEVIKYKRIPATMTTRVVCPVDIGAHPIATRVNFRALSKCLDLANEKLAEIEREMSAGSDH